MDTATSAVAETGTHLMEEKIFYFQERLCSIWIKINSTQMRHWYQADTAASFQGPGQRLQFGLAWQSTPSVGGGHPPDNSSCFVLWVASLLSHTHPPQSAGSSLCSAPTLCCSRKCYCTGDIFLRRLTFPFGRSYSLYSPFYLLLLWLMGHCRGYFNIAVIKDLWW